jgi:hypothetical protein
LSLHVQPPKTTPLMSAVSTSFRIPMRGRLQQRHPRE